MKVQLQGFMTSIEDNPRKNISITKICNDKNTGVGFSVKVCKRDISIRTTKQVKHITQGEAEGRHYHKIRRSQS